MVLQFQVTHLTLLWLLTATPANGRSCDPRLIIPGEAMGCLSLGASRAEARRILGPPDLRYPPGPKGYEKQIWKPHIPLWVRFRGGRVIQIGAYDPAYRTSGGVRPDASLAEVMREWPRLTVTSFVTEGFAKSGGVCYYDAVNEGIAFKFAEDHSMAHTGQPLPFQLVEIIVHPKGVQVVPEENEVPGPVRCPSDSTI